jgi:hypothetical protein
LGMGRAEQLDERDVISNLQLIDKIDRHKMNRKKRKRVPRKILKKLFKIMNQYFIQKVSMK